MRSKALFQCLIALLFLSFLIPLETHAVEVICFEGTFERSAGKPTPASQSFPGAFSGPALVRLWNGSDDAHRISSAEITINGVLVFGPSNFNQKVSYLEAIVTLNEGENNTCEVLLKSKPGGQITIEIVQEVDAEAAAFIGPEGGVVEVTDTDTPIFGAAVHAGPNTIPELLLLTITEGETASPLPIDMEPAGPCVNLGPEGIEFRVPVIVTIPVTSDSKEQTQSLGIAYFNAGSQTWQLVPSLGYATEEKRLIFMTDHFSEYRPVKYTTEGDTFGVEFDIRKDSMAFDNVLDPSIGCPSYSDGVCSAMIAFTKWYYEKVREPATGQHLRCIYPRQVAGNISCSLWYDWPTLGRVWDGITGVLPELYQRIVQKIDMDPIKNSIIKDLKAGEPVNLGIHGTLNGLEDKGHVLLVVGWVQEEVTTGYFDVYDPNDNLRLHRLEYEQIDNIGRLIYDDHTWTNYTDVKVFAVQTLRGVDFAYYHNNPAYPKSDQDNDGIGDNCDPPGFGCCDQCPNTPFSETVNKDGCSISQLLVELEAPENNRTLDPSNGINFGWKRLDHPNEPYFHYFISVKEDADPEDAVFFEGFVGENNEIILYGFEHGKQYFWSVWAVDEYGNWSKARDAGDWGTFSTIPAVPEVPIPPTNLSASYDATNGWNWIAWSPVPGATSYKLYWGTEPGVTKDSEYGGEIFPPSAQFSHTGVVPGWTYYYRVCSVNDASESDLSDEVSAYVTGLPPPLPTTMTRVSVASDGTQANRPSTWAVISADGRFVAFSSMASNLVPNDTNGNFYDVFVHDRQTGTTERVSVASDGSESNDWSYCTSISADGRFVAFSSMASNLVPGDTIGSIDGFVHDRQTGITEYIPGANDAPSAFPLISADGRFVAFSVGPGVFVRERQTGITEEISYAFGRNFGVSSISPDARFVAFNSDILSSGPMDFRRDVFVHDRQTGITELVSVASDGTQSNYQSSGGAISADGRFVVFASQATNLVPGDINGWTDVFVRDRQTGITELVSVASDGGAANSSSYGASISADGRFVVFGSMASNLVPGISGICIFVRDRQTGVTDYISDTNAAESTPPSISADGRFVVFDSRISNLVPNDTNGCLDVFVVGNPLWP